MSRQLSADELAFLNSQLRSSGLTANCDQPGAEPRERLVPNLCGNADFWTSPVPTAAPQLPSLFSGPIETVNILNTWTPPAEVLVPVPSADFWKHG